MCFTATASFGIAALLLPVGILSVKIAKRLNPNWLPLALFPIAFSIQQIIEGLLWLGVTSNNEQLLFFASRGFLFFSHLFWLAWVPYAIHRLEKISWRKKLLYALAWVGAIAGLSVFLPLLVWHDWVAVKQVHHSLNYNTVLIYDAYFDRTIMRGLYGFFIASSLFLSSDTRIQMFGFLILFSLIVSIILFSYALISVWCFFSAALSGFIIFILLNEQQRSGRGNVAHQT